GRRVKRLLERLLTTSHLNGATSIIGRNLGDDLANETTKHRPPARRHLIDPTEQRFVLRPERAWRRGMTLTKALLIVEFRPSATKPILVDDPSRDDLSYVLSICLHVFVSSFGPLGKQYYESLLSRLLSDILVKRRQMPGCIQQSPLCRP